MAQQPIIFITGVAGSGKTTVGRRLSSKTGLPFYDGDDFHSEANVAKMASGTPLTDEDRQGWLESINVFVRKELDISGGIIACSALKESYRNILVSGVENPVKWILLNGEKEVIRERIKRRKKHFFSEELLQSQFDILEKSDRALVVDVNEEIPKILVRIMKGLNL